MADNSNLIVAALERTDPQLAASIDAGNAWQNAIKKRGARVALYRDYERGDHRADITTEMKKMLRINSDDAELTDFNDNYCKVVVDKMAGRLFVSNIAVDENAQDVREWLTDLLDYQDFDAQQSDWYRGAVRDGDSFIMVDSQTMRWVSEPAYDGFDGLVVIFDSITRKALWACKLWSQADTSDISGDDTSYSVVMKLVVYQPGVISHWKGQEGGTEISADNQYIGDGNEFVNYEPFPLDRLPIVQFANQKDNYTNYGESELRPAIPLQDVLNRTLHSMVMASELSAFRQYYSIGMKIDADAIVPGAIHNLVPFEVENAISDEQIEYMKAIRVGQFEASDISQYTNQVDKVVQQISQSTQTPIYGVTTQGNLSGEALKQLEIGLLGKIERFQHQNTDAIRELIQLTAEMQNAFENDLEFSVPAQVDNVKVIWKPAEILDVNARITTLTALREKAPGLFTDEFYIKRIGTLIGMSQDDINTEIEKARNQQGLAFDLFTAANAEQAA